MGKSRIDDHAAGSSLEGHLKASRDQRVALLVWAEL